VDNLIFAMVPLGIVTTITGAIRTQGPRLVRAFIGRARENRALAELEVMSSTSGEVCEVFNGQSVVRVMGKPDLKQFIIFPDLYDALEEKYKEDSDNDDDSCGIHTLESALGDNHKGLKIARYGKADMLPGVSIPIIANGAYNTTAEVTVSSPLLLGI
jgi:hypothetical protein